MPCGFVRRQASKYRELAGTRGVQVAQLETEVSSLKATVKNLRLMQVSVLFFKVDHVERGGGVPTAACSGDTDPCTHLFSKEDHVNGARAVSGDDSTTPSQGINTEHASVSTRVL